ncbi:MAG TPA: DUF1772 domain-containing protein [Candidatus Limnocylindria bacterium]|nr:DUF1772 domain-containing protein [Candidatus Limnocylindria bacterium]
MVELMATLCCGLFAGAAVYISLVEHPARMVCGTGLAATEFVPSYKRAAVMQASLAVLGLLLSLMAWRLSGRAPWAVGGVVLGAVVPFTLLVLRPTNDALLDPALDRDSERARTLLERWARLHAVRSVVSLVAFAVLLWAHGTW